MWEALQERCMSIMVKPCSWVKPEACTVQGLEFPHITLPGVDFVCFVTVEKIWGITYHTQASSMWAMNPQFSLTKGSNFTRSQKEHPVLDDNMVKTALCKQVSKSVSLRAQWDKVGNSVFELLWLCYEKHKVNLHCYQNLKVVSRQERRWFWRHDQSGMSTCQK